MVPFTPQSAARYLARGGETGPYLADEFLELVANQTFRQWMGMGISSNGKASRRLVMGFLSPLQLEAMGWNRKPGTDGAWREWAEWDWALENWRQQQTMKDEKTGQTITLSPSSTIYKKKREEVMGAALADLFARYPEFKDEYEFSQLPLHKRLEKFGVGTGTSKEQQGMGQFLAIVDDMWNELDRTLDNTSSKKNPKYGVTSGSQAGGPVVIKYLGQVAALASNPEYKEWWAMFKGTYPLSKFGFHTNWRPAEYDWLYREWDNEIEATEPEEEEFSYEGGY
jgi:hypothetical protein